MDSLTQAVLGAVVATAVLAPRIGPRKAVLAGAILGTLPDLDVLVPFADPVDEFILHRGPSHSLLMHAAVTPILGEALRLTFRGLRNARAAAWAAVFLCLTTHALLDAMTVYGTKLLWPLTDYPFGVGSMFIIDPLYTVPLLVAVIWALSVRRFQGGVRLACHGALALSTAYLGWSVIAQHLAEARADRVLEAAGIEADQRLAIAGPFTTLTWKVIAIDGDRYLNLYIPAIGPDSAVDVHVHPRHMAAIGCIADSAPLPRLAEFAKGDFALTPLPEGRVAYADLRMGLTPSYVFRFVLADANGPLAVPERLNPTERAGAGDWAWLGDKLMGRAAIRPIEAAAHVPLAELGPMPSGTPGPRVAVGLGGAAAPC